MTMNLKRYLRLFITAIFAVAVGMGIWGCEAPDYIDAIQSETTDSTAVSDSAAAAHKTNDVGGSYGKNGVAPFGMAQRLPKQIDVERIAGMESSAVSSTTVLLADQNALFAVHCVACHGADGLGVEPLGVTLVGSPFVSSKSTEELIAMLKVGRLPDSMDSVKGRVMPGFAWMSDEQLTDLAVLLKAQNP